MRATTGDGGGNGDDGGDEATGAAAAAARSFTRLAPLSLNLRARRRPNRIIKRAPRSTTAAIAVAAATAAAAAAARLFRVLQSKSQSFLPIFGCVANDPIARFNLNVC